MICAIVHLNRVSFFKFSFARCWGEGMKTSVKSTLRAPNWCIPESQANFKQTRVKK